MLRREVAHIRHETQMSTHKSFVLELITALACSCAGLSACDSARVSPNVSQDASTVTRAQVKADLKSVEDRGYQPISDPPDYPNDIQNAEKGLNGSPPGRQ
jgi:Domain of unknown function (DUF4148)